MKSINPLILGIDASNLSRGGGITHLRELLRHSNPQNYDFYQIILWGTNETLNMVEDKKWLIKKELNLFSNNLIFRMFWQKFILAKEARKYNCNLIFIPGGSYLGNFKPYVTMSRNMLPFESREIFRYGISLMALKLILLKIIQKATIRNAQGTIFLSKYAKNKILQSTGSLKGCNLIISHGVDQRFFSSPKHQLSISKYNESAPYRLIYVSTIDLYKHQCNVITAISNLREIGFPLELILIGHSYKPALKKMNEAISKHDKYSRWISYYGSVEYQKLKNIYKSSDLAIFASSCENMPNILIEMMASGLPIACSNLGPMPEMLGKSGLYFNPENINEIQNAIYNLIKSAKLRKKLSNFSYKNSLTYSWKKTSDKTFSFLRKLSS